jgi:hypothetical protein
MELQNFTAEPKHEAIVFGRRLTGQIKVGYSDEIGLGNATGSAGADSSPRASLFTIRPFSVAFCPFYGVTPTGAINDGITVEPLARPGLFLASHIIGGAR